MIALLGEKRCYKGRVVLGLHFLAQVIPDGYCFAMSVLDSAK